eukprot:scaffold137914_cov99-Phaeocystis_antarctica.AAC.1
MGMAAISNGGGAGAGHGGGGGRGEANSGPSATDYTCYAPHLNMQSGANLLAAPITATSLSACQDACTQTVGCVAFVYNSQSQCYLKAAIGSVTSSDPQYHTVSCRRSLDVGNTYGDLLWPVTSGSGGGSGLW